MRYGQSNQVVERCRAMRDYVMLARGDILLARSHSCNTHTSLASHTHTHAQTTCALRHALLAHSPACLLWMLSSFFDFVYMDRASKSALRIQADAGCLEGP